MKVTLKGSLRFLWEIWGTFDQGCLTALSNTRKRKRVEKSKFKSSIESVIILEKAASRAKLIISWRQGVVNITTTVLGWRFAIH